MAELAFNNNHSLTQISQREFHLSTQFRLLQNKCRIIKIMVAIIKIPQ